MGPLLSLSHYSVSVISPYFVCFTVVCVVHSLFFSPAWQFLLQSSVTSWPVQVDFRDVSGGKVYSFLAMQKK